jgi:hypothetical protein
LTIFAIFSNPNAVHTGQMERQPSLTVSLFLGLPKYRAHCTQIKPSAADTWKQMEAKPGKRFAVSLFY